MASKFASRLGAGKIKDKDADTTEAGGLGGDEGDDMYDFGGSSLSSTTTTSSRQPSSIFSLPSSSSTSSKTASFASTTSPTSPPSLASSMASKALNLNNTNSSPISSNGGKTNNSYLGLHEKRQSGAAAAPKTKIPNGIYSEKELSSNDNSSKKVAEKSHGKSSSRVIRHKNSNSNSNKEDIDDDVDSESNDCEYNVRRYAVKYDPPTLVIEYLSNATGKKYIRKLKFKANPSNRDPKALAAKVVESNSDILNKDLIDVDQIVDLISLLFSNEESDNFENRNHSNNHSSQSAGNKNNNTAASNKAISNSKTIELENSILRIDLNKASDAVVAKAKEIMSVDFEKNRVRPDSVEFQYDKRVEFAPPAASSEWDDDEEDD